MGRGHDRKNILLISLDDMIDVVRYRTAFGVEISTPAIDALVERGVLFANAFTASPICNSARTAALTGRSPFATGVHHNDGAWINHVVPVEETLIGRAHAAGWHTAARGKLFHGRNFSAEVRAYLEPALDEADWTWGHQSAGPSFPGPLGGSSLPDDAHYDVISARWAARFLQDPPEETPFLLSVGLTKPHFSWDVPRRFFDRYDRDRIEVPDLDDLGWLDLPRHFRNLLQTGGDWAQRRIEAMGAETWRDAVHAYLAAVSFADAQVGEVIGALDRAGGWDDTTVLLWSDHGHHLGDRDVWHKFTLWEEAASVPLVVVDPDLGRPGARVETPASILDIWPTLASLTGLPPPAAADGLDLAPLMADPEAGLPREGVVTSAYASRALRTDAFRYNLYTSGEEELFEVGGGEVFGRDVSGRPGFDGVLAEMRARLVREAAALGVEVVAAGEDRVGGAGSETLVLVGDARGEGRGGDDTYHLTPERRVAERGDGGADRAVIATDVDWRLPRAVEAGALTSGSDGALIGNALNNRRRATAGTTSSSAGAAATCWRAAAATTCCAAGAASTRRTARAAPACA